MTRTETVQPETRGLSPAELATYAEDGQVTPDFRLGEAALAEIRDASEALVNARPDIRPEFIPLPHVPFDGSAEAKALARRFLDFARRPEILDLVESVTGPDIVFWTAALFCKPGGDGRPVPWHQDGVYWPLEPMETVTVWVALDASDEENGCMKYLPGTHKGGFLQHYQSEADGLVLNTTIVESELDAARARCVELQPGQVSMHDAFLVHGSAPNTSTRRRAGLTLRYMPASVRYDRERRMGSGSNTAPLEFANRPIWLVRGVDRAGNDYTRGRWDLDG